MYNLKMEMQHEEEEYIHNAIIPPPVLTDADTKTTRIMIDSKDRDTVLFPDQNCYEVRFDDDIEDVMSVQLQSIDIPLSSYMINKYFNTFTLSFDNTDNNVVLDYGDYTPAEFADMVTTKMNAISNKHFHVEYVTFTDNFKISANSSFSISFKKQDDNASLHSLFGFNHDTYTAIQVGSQYVIKSLYRKNFKFNNYLVMSIDQFDLLKSNNNNIHRTFAVIVENYSNINIGDLPQLLKTFTPPIARIARIKISFKDRFGNPYDFQNIDHRIELIFTSFKQKRKYQNLFINRGS